MDEDCIVYETGIKNGTQEKRKLKDGWEAAGVKMENGNLKLLLRFPGYKVRDWKCNKFNLIQSHKIFLA